MHGIKKYVGKIGAIPFKDLESVDFEFNHPPGYTVNHLMYYTQRKGIYQTPSRHHRPFC